MKTQIIQFTRQAITNVLMNLSTSTPGHLISYDPKTGMSKIQVGIKMVLIDDTQMAIAPIIECPTHNPGGSDWFLETEMTPGSEGLIIFGQRSIDGWREQGGTAEQPLIRFHNISDAMFIPGIRSKANAIQDHANNGVRMRNADGSAYVWLKGDKTVEAKNDSCTVTISNDGSITATSNSMLMDAPAGITINGTSFMPGGVVSANSVTAPSVNATNDLKFGGIDAGGHVHKLPGGGTTEGPQ